MEGNTNTNLLRKLSAAVSDQAANATFACGGTVDCPDTSKDGVTPRVIIRWDNDDDNDHHKASFPCSQDAIQAFEALVQACQPATFGFENRDVLDENYRKAGKLGNSAFSTNFHPHDCGIVDAVQQILMPVGGSPEEDKTPQGVRAELYKLNVYSAPSGKFLPHVDTPRGLTQFGSLVVCLPYAHEGGTLRVKHSGQTVDFAWAASDPRSIQWAAFYGDCEHEALEVTSGHRVTLTYNLYYTDIADLALPVSDPTKLPLYETVAQMLREPKFMRFGGRIGFFCHHAYAHSTEAGRKLIPGAFKGVDLAIFAAFGGLGLEVDVNPILHKENQGFFRTRYENGWGGLSAEALLSGCIDNGYGSLHFGPGPVLDPNTTGDFVEEYLGLVDRKQQGATLHLDEDDPNYDDDEETMAEFMMKQEVTVVGSDLHGPTFKPEIDDDSGDADCIEEWPHTKIPQIIWMNEPQHQDFAYAGLAYGNEAELDYKFSAAAILVSIPSSRARGLCVPTAANVGKAEPTPAITTRPTHSPMGTSAFVDLTEDEEIAKPILGWWAGQRMNSSPEVRK
ncbi:MAG: hypothetical protein Q9169_006310 [Polycauliona sp. 2 TL-2023]